MEKETDIQKAICEYLSYRRCFFWRQNTIPAMTKAGGYRAMPKYSLNGVPDIIMMKDGIFWGLEVKRPKGKQSDAQKEFEKRPIEAGGKYNIVTSIDDVIALGL